MKKADVPKRIRYVSAMAQWADSNVRVVTVRSRACNLFAQLGVRGASVMFSSGDGGVGAGTCQTNDGTNRTIFQPVSCLSFTLAFC